MEGTNTNTQNENSNNLLSLEEKEKFEKLMKSKDSKCMISLTDSGEVLSPGLKASHIEIIVTEIQPQPPKDIKDNVKPPEQGDSIVVGEATELNGDTRFVLKGGRLVEITKKGNATLQAAKNRIDLQKEAEDKYAKNNPTSPEGR